MLSQTRTTSSHELAKSSHILAFSHVPRLACDTNFAHSQQHACRGLAVLPTVDFCSWRLKLISTITPLGLWFGLSRMGAAPVRLLTMLNKGHTKIWRTKLQILVRHG